MNVRKLAIAGLLAVGGLGLSADRATARVTLGRGGVSVGGAAAGSSVVVPYTGVRGTTVVSPNGAYTPATGTTYSPAYSTPQGTSYYSPQTGTYFNSNMGTYTTPTPNYTYAQQPAYSGQTVTTAQPPTVQPVIGSPGVVPPSYYGRSAYSTPGYSTYQPGGRAVYAPVYRGITVR